MRALALTAGAGLLAGAGLVGFTSPVNAAANGAAALARPYKYTMHTDDKAPGGVVRFAPDGDYVHLEDIEKDGWAVHLWVSDATTGKFKYQGQVGGKGNYLEWHATLGAKYDLAEKHVIKFKICLKKAGSQPSYCDTSNWSNVN